MKTIGFFLGINQHFQTHPCITGTVKSQAWLTVDAVARFGAWGKVVFNNLLGGCINDCKLELAKDFCTM